MPSQITIELRGSSSDAGAIRLEEFTEQLTAVRNALRETERAITGREPALYYRIVDLKHASPHTVVLEAASDAIVPEQTNTIAKVVARHFGANLRFLSRKKRPSRTATVPVLESYRGMTSPLEKHIIEVVITAGNHSVLINKAFKQTVEEVLGPEESTYGSISGTIEALNVHNTNRFTLYPTVGPSKLVGNFPRSLRPKIIGAITKYVTVYGNLRYKTWNKFPHAIDADDLDIHEPPVTTLSEIHGMAPDATSGMPADEFIERLRNENW